MTIASPDDIFFDQLNDLKSATEQVVGTLPDLIGWAADSGLREALEAILLDAQSHLRIIGTIFEGHSKQPGDDICKAIAGLIDGGNNHLEMAADASVRDHLLIAHDLRIAHYLKAAGQFTLGMARSRGYQEEADGLREILHEWVSFITTLGEIAARSFGLELGGDE